MSVTRGPKGSRRKIDKDVDALYEAVQQYVEARGGKLIVIGGVQVQEWPQDNAGVFYVAVKCLGSKPSLGVGDGKP